MATNPYFNSNYFGQQEQSLIDQLTQESIQIHGIDVKYIKRELIGFDRLLNEDLVSKYKDTYTIEMYIKSFDTFNGASDFLSKFGYEIQDELTLQVSTTRFQEEVTSLAPEIIHPREGDLIYFPFSKRVFEIRYVEHEEVFYQAGNLYTYELRCKVFDVSGEDFETGDPNIDSTEQNDSDIIFVLDSGTGAFAVNETVTMTNLANFVVASAQVDSWDVDTKTLTVHDVKGEFVSGLNIVGGTSGASWLYVDSGGYPNANANDPNAMNNIVHEEADPLLVLGKSNKLG